MARNLAEIVKEMRNSPPRKGDDPRFDELEQMAADMGGELESPEGEGEMPPEEGAAPPEQTPEELDAAMMDEAMGGPGAVPASPEGLSPSDRTPEEEMLGASAKKPARAPARANPLMKKKKSSYLAM